MLRASLRSLTPVSAWQTAASRDRQTLPGWRLARHDPRARPDRDSSSDVAEREALVGGPQQLSRPARSGRLSWSGSRPGPRRVAVGLVVCVLSLGVGACSMRGARAEASASASASASAAVARAEQGIANANASATASREAALSPELRAQRDAALAEPAPDKPPQMNEETAEGAAASVGYFLDLYRYAFMTGNTTELTNMSEGQCKFCQSAIERATTLHATGGWIDKWDQNISGATYYEKLKEYNYNRVAVTVDYGPMTSHPGDGGASKTSEKDDGRVLNFGVRYVNGNWSIGGVEVSEK